MYQTIFKCTLLAMLFITQCQQEVKESVYILPDNYTGYVVVIFDQPDGVEREMLNDKSVYRIPDNGILKTQDRSILGSVQRPSFYFGKVSDSKKIEFVSTAEQLPKNKVVAFGGSTGRANKDLEGRDAVEFIQYFIGNEGQIDIAYQAVQQLDIANY